MKANYLHTAGILAALCMGAACTSNQGVLGVKKDVPPVSRGTSVDKEEKRMMPLNASENTAIVARGSLSVPIPFPKEEAKDIEIKISNARPASGPTFRDSIVPCQLEEQVFGYLSPCELETIRGTNKVLKRCSEAYTHRQRLLDIYHDKQGSFREFFVKPNSPPVRWIADYRGENAEALRNKFMRELYAQADPKTMLKWLQEAPPRLLAYGHRVGFSNCAFMELTSRIIPRIFEKSDFQNVIRVCRALLVIQNERNTRLYSHWAHNTLAQTCTEQLLFFAYIKSNDATLKKEAMALMRKIVVGEEDFAHAMEHYKNQLLNR